MAAAAISHLRRGAQRHALLYLSRRHFSSNSPLAAARPLAAAARRLLSTSVESGTSSTAGSYKPPPLDPFRAALAPASLPLESPPLEEAPAAPPLASAAAAPEQEQDPVDLQNEELDGLKAGVEAVRSREESPQEKEAWWLLNRAVVNYCGSAVGTVAANDPSTANHMLNYDQVFIRDFVPSAIAFLLKGESEIVKNFLLHTLQLQSWEKTVDCYSPGQGLMPASFKVRTVPLDGNNEAFEEVLDPDFGESAIGRVAPVDSGLWWIILLRAYGKITGDYALQERVDVQTGIRLILNLCLSDGFDMFPTLLVTDGSCMIDRRMGIHGHPLEIQERFCQPSDFFRSGRFYPCLVGVFTHRCHGQVKLTRSVVFSPRVAVSLPSHEPFSLTRTEHDRLLPHLAAIPAISWSATASLLRREEQNDTPTTSLPPRSIPSAAKPLSWTPRFGRHGRHKLLPSKPPRALPVDAARNFACCWPTSRPEPPRGATRQPVAFSVGYSHPSVHGIRGELLPRMRIA